MFKPVIFANFKNPPTAAINVAIMLALFGNKMLSLGQLAACGKSRASETLLFTLRHSVVFNMCSSQYLSTALIWAPDFQVIAHVDD